MLTREQVKALLIVDEAKPYSHAHRLVLMHDAKQRAEIERQAKRIQELEKTLKERMP
jgi:hypothetical protein